MRILQVHTRYRERGGEDSVVENEAQLLEQAGHVVERFEGRNAEGATAAARQLARSAWNLKAARELTASMQLFRPDIVHVHNTWFALSPAVVAAAGRTGTPVVMTLHNYRLVCVSSNLFRDGRICEDCVGRGPWPGVAHRCYRDNALASGALAANIVLHRRRHTWERTADLFVSVSEFGIERHVAGGVPRDRIVVKDNFAPDPGSRTAPPSESNEVLFVGRSSPEKGLELLLDGWSAAESEDLRLTVIGQPPPSVTAPDGVRFTGPLPKSEVAQRMLRARALVIPSQWPEGQPLALLEALAAGLPVLGSAVGGIDEVLRGDSGARRIPLADPAAWTRAIEELAGASHELDDRGKRSRAVYERRFSPQTALQELLDVYSEAAERRRRPPPQTAR